MKVVVVKWVSVVEENPFKGPFRQKEMRVLYSNHEDIHHGDRIDYVFFEILARQEYVIISIP